jgi:hypothetical protein
MSCKKSCGFSACSRCGAGNTKFSRLLEMKIAETGDEKELGIPTFAFSVRVSFGFINGRGACRSGVFMKKITVQVT